MGFTGGTTKITQQSQIANALIGDPLMAGLGVSTADLAVDTRPYWGRWLWPVRRTSGGTQVATANRAFICPIYVPRKMTLDQASVSLTVAGNGNLKFGIYSDNTDTVVGGNLKATIGPLATGFQTTGAFAPALQLPQGLYWGGVILDNAVDTFVHASGINELGNDFDGCRYNAGSFNFTDPCPAVTDDSSAAPNILLRIKSIDA